LSRPVYKYPVDSGALSATSAGGGLLVFADGGLQWDRCLKMRRNAAMSPMPRYLRCQRRLHPGFTDVDDDGYTVRKGEVTAEIPLYHVEILKGISFCGLLS